MNALRRFFRQPGPDESLIVWTGTLVIGVLTLICAVFAASAGRWEGFLFLGFAALSLGTCWATRRRPAPTEADHGAPLRVTPAAAEQIGQAAGPGGLTGERCVRVAASGIGVDQQTRRWKHTHSLNLADAPEEGDVRFSAAGLPFATPGEGLSRFAGTTLDYAESDAGAGFVFDNPHDPALHEQMEARRKATDPPAPPEPSANESAAVSPPPRVVREPISVTPAAAEVLRQSLGEKLRGKVRIRVRLGKFGRLPDGSWGHVHTVDLVWAPREGDVTFLAAGLPFVVSPDDLEHLTGTVIEAYERDGESGINFRNPKDMALSEKLVKFRKEHPR